MQTDRVLLDTHALLWWQAGSQFLSRTASVVIAQADQVFVSPISFWEVSMLVDKGRIVLDRPVLAWVNDLLSSSVEPAEFTPRIAVTAGALGNFHGDPADRMIYSTAQVEGLPLISKDRRLTEAGAPAGSVEIIW